MDTAKKVYKGVDTTANVHDTVSHQTEAVSLPGQVVDYASKFAVGKKFPFWSPERFTAPFEAMRQKMVHTFDELMLPDQYKRGRESIGQFQDMEEFQRQSIRDFESMSPVLKREMGKSYDTQLMGMHDELLKRQQTTLSAKHEVEKMKMNFGHPWSEES